FSLVESRGKAVFGYKGKDRWVIDTSQFGGAAKLRVSRSDGLIRLQLSGAKFPGTDISADFRAEIKEGISGWWMTLTLGMARVRTRVPFERWLDGREPAEATALMRSSSIRLGTTARAVIGGAGTLAFSPDWSVRLRGERLAKLEGLGSRVDSADVVVRLLGRDEGSSLQGRVARRTLISIARGKNMWDIDLPAGPEGSRLEAVDSGFDRVDIESRLSRLGHTERILVAGSERDGDALLFFPAEDILGLDRMTFGIPVRNARYAMTFDPAHEERAVTAAFAAEPAWMHIDGCALGLGAVEGTSPFVLRHRDGKTTVQCKPSLLGVAGGLADAVVEPQPLHRGTDVELVWGKTTRRRDKNTARLTVRHGRHDVIIPNYVASILRPEDLLALRLEYYGYDLLVGGGNPPELVRNAKTAIMIARFAPQNIAEQAFFEIQGSGTAPDPDPHPAGSENPLQPGYLQGNIAGPSRLAFDIPATVTTIPYTLAGVLDWSMFTQRVAPGALPPGVVPGPNSPTPIVEPPDDKTSIESPYRLMISPNIYAYWNHTSDLVPGPGGEVELWHTRLGVRAPDNSVHDDNDPTDSDLRTVRAIWSPDYTTGTAPLPFDPSALTYYNPYRMSLDANDRYQIVRLTSDYNSTTFNNGVTAAYIPSPAEVERLALTTLGAWMNVRGYWSPDISGLEVTEWRHRATMGRDQYVRVVRAGYLWPFGHKASLIKITERKLVRTLTNLGSPGPIVAYLRQHFYILVRQPVKTYYGPHDAGVPSPPDYPGIGTWPGGYEGRQMPFKTVQITTLATPDIEDPNSAQSSGDFASPPSPPSGFGHEDAFWPIVLVNGTPTDFQWHLIGTDWDGNSVEFTMPLVYLGLDIGAAPQPPKSNFSNLNYIETQYKKSPKTTAQMHGAKIAFAPSAAVASGKGTDPAVTTDSVTFGGVVVPDSVADTAGDLPPDQPQFYPFFAVSQAEIPAIKHLLGKNAQSHVAVADPFLKNGFDGNQNKGEVFMHLVKSDFPFSGLSEQLPLVFGQGDTGQVVTPGTMSPNLSVAGLSRSIGPLGAVLNSGVSDFTSMANGSFDPTSFFDPNSLLGGSLPKLFGAVSLTDILNGIPDFTKDLNKIPGLKVMHDSKMIHVQFFWETDQIKQWPSGGPNSAIFAPWLINGDGTPTYPQGNPHYPGNVVTSTTPTPPPIPDVSDDGSGSVNNSGDDPSHVWAATYIIGGNETIVGLGNTYDVSQGGGQSGDRKIKVTVDQNNVADGGMNIYRSKVG
ncbi:MAG TPA: hypothetical protein VG815_20795, partial [Chloroflexota bacterium]|nr:hypothetical protein [Chloroflexota bacterium]